MAQKILKSVAYAYAEKILYFTLDGSILNIADKHLGQVDQIGLKCCAERAGQDHLLHKTEQFGNNKDARNGENRLDQFFIFGIRHKSSRKGTLEGINALLIY